MTSPTQIATSLKASLSEEAQILIDPESSDFKESLKRWSDVGIQIPAAIIKAGCEDDIVKIVNTATTNQIPLVSRGGGNSPWSTIGPQGWILDLSLLSNITLSPSTQTATLGPGVLSKSINEAVSNIGFCIQSPGSSKVACIPFILGGGSSYLNGLYGMAVDSLISARVVTAKRGLVTASEEENQDLFWALKGAGHFFGVVTSVTMRMYPLKETVISWNCFFPAEAIKEVAAALEVVSKGEQVVRSPGLVGIMAPPGSSKVCFGWNACEEVRTDVKTANDHGGHHAFCARRRGGESYGSVTGTQSPATNQETCTLGKYDGFCRSTCWSRRDQVIDLVRHEEFRREEI